MSYPTAILITPKRMDNKMKRTKPEPEAVLVIAGIVIFNLMLVAVAFLR